MNKLDIKDAEEYLKIRAETYIFVFEKELQDFNIDDNYRLNLEASNTSLIFGSTLDALLLGQFLAASIIDREINLKDKIKYLEVIALVESKIKLDTTSDISKFMGSFSRKNAFKSHKETYELKNQAIEHWRSHIDPKLSNPKAADLLLKVVKV